MPETMADRAARTLALFHSQLAQLDESCCPECRRRDLMRDYIRGEIERLSRADYD